MTKKDLFRVILKLVGLYFIIHMLFSTLPNLMFFINFGDDANLLNILLGLAALSIFVLLFLVLVFKPDLVINILKLDKSFDDHNIVIKLPSISNILQVGIIILGLSVIVKQLPVFITSLFILFKTYVIDSGSKINSNMQIANIADSTTMITNIISLTLCFLIITNSRSITKYILSRNLSNKID